MSMLSPGSRLGNYPYQVVKVLNETPGNMSEVCIASVRNRGENNDSQVVIKLAAGPEVKHAEFHRQALLNESKRLRLLKHPGIVRIFPIQFENERRALQYDAAATGLAGKPWFIVTELLSGGSLTKMIKENGLDIPMALEVARSLSATLDYLHSRNQVHLDLKPDNVLFRTPPISGQPVESVLIDFGIARDFGEDGLQAKTPHYASPERVYELRNPRQPPERLARPHPSMDIYALGVMLYEMLTGVLPFDGITETKLLSAIINSNPKPPSNINNKIVSDLEAYVLKMMAKEPSERPTARDVAINLEELAIRAGYQSRYPTSNPLPTSSDTPKSRRPKINRWLVLLILLVIAELLFILATRPYWNGKISARALAQNLNPFAVAVAESDGETSIPSTALPAEEATSTTPTSVALGVTPALVPSLSAAEDPSPETPPPQETSTPIPTPIDSTSVVKPTATPKLVQKSPTSTIGATVKATQTAAVQPVRATSKETSIPIATSTAIAATDALAATTNTPPFVTSTPIPSTPTAVAIEIETPTVATTTVATTKFPTPRPEIAVKVSVEPQLPGNDERIAGGGQTIFSWKTSGQLAANQCFELFRWEDGQDRDVTGLGMKSASTNANAVLRLDDVRPALKSNVKYRWGVRVISCPNIKTGRIRPTFVGGGWSFWYEPGAGSSSNAAPPLKSVISGG